jgi:hypothetical protein
VNSRTKGKRGEREFASLLREHGFDARRGQQFCGGEDNREFLTPLGKPKANAHKYFAAVEILAYASDVSWLNKATHAIYEHWKTKNANRSQDSSLAIAA